MIDRLLDHYEGTTDESRTKDKSVRQTAEERDDPLLVDPYSPGDLRYTKVLTASFGDRDVDGPRGPNWNRLLMVAHETALTEFGSFEKLSRLSDTNIKQGKHTDSGYHYNADHNFSMQNKPAKDAWRHSLKLARKLDLPVSVSLSGRKKRKLLIQEEQLRSSGLEKSSSGGLRTVDHYPRRAARR